MDKIRLGRTEMIVSRLGFGGVPIQRVPEKEAVAVVKGCIALGVDFIDTALGYTTSEERIGKAIRGHRGELVIATKSFARTRRDMEEHLQLSLQHLGVDTIDLYQLHNVSSLDALETVLGSGGPMAVLESAKREGVIRHIGITCHSIDTAREAVKTDRFETIMFPFNVITCEPADGLLPLAREHDVGMIAMKPLAGGRLDNVAIAFKYLFQFHDVLPIPGIESVSEMAELTDLLAGEADMTESDLAEMARMREELGAMFCRRCDYCQPCPEGIPISGAIAISNPEKRMPPERLFHGWIDQVLARAAECVECGECEERCPYHLPIMRMMAQEVEWYQEEKRRHLERTEGE